MDSQRYLFDPDHLPAPPLRPPGLLRRWWTRREVRALRAHLAPGEVLDLQLPVLHEHAFWLLALTDRRLLLLHFGLLPGTARERELAWSKVRRLAFATGGLGATVRIGARDRSEIALRLPKRDLMPLLVHLRDRHRAFLDSRQAPVAASRHSAATSDQ